MIEANELRIGNWVICKAENKCGYFNFYKQIYYHDFNLTDDFDPIPLTPEILDKAGFVKDEIHNCYVIYQNDDHIDVEYSCEYGTISMGGHNSASEMDHIKSLHQLQNLFYALTGEELEINL